MHPVVYCEFLKDSTPKELDGLNIVKVFEEGIDATLKLAGKDRDLRVTMQHPDNARIDISCTVEELKELMNSELKETR